MDDTTQIVIVGAGPVGMSTALSLARMGVKTIVVEKHPSITNHPKARGVNVRSMEIFRLWGLEDKMREQQLPAEAHRFIWLESLQGKEITRVSEKLRSVSVSPTIAALISQDWVEAVLLDAIKANPLIDLRFNTRMLNIDTQETGVRTTVHDLLTDKQYPIHSRYLVAADGANSTTREIFNIPMTGKEMLGEYCNIYCEMDLEKYVKDRPSVGFMFTRRDIMGTFMLAKDGLKRWLIGLRYDVLPDLDKKDITDEFCIDFIRQVIADDTIEIKLINKAFWTMAALVATSFRQGNVLLAGDAAHRLPPTGGLGMNTGIQDAHNLAWKLAMVIQGKAQEQILESYFQERAPVAAANIAWSSKNAERFNTIFEALAEKNYAAMTQALEEQNEHLNHLGLDLGFCYEHGLLMVNESAPFHAIKSTEYIPSTYPGCRAPHYEVHNKEGRLISLLDLFETDFVLLCSDKEISWQKAALTFQEFPLKSYCIGEAGDFQDSQGKWLHTYQITESGAVLIRPDGHVMWRAKKKAADPAAVLRQVFEQAGFIVL